MSAYDYFIGRGVTRLCHFTTLRSLTHILCSEDGILASSSISQDTKVVNDRARYDGETDHVCCSVEYPNSWYKNRAVSSNSDVIFNEWVVIYISPEILKIRSAKFCPCNASSAGGLYITDSYENLYQSSVSSAARTITRATNMLECCPTDGQAEVLISENIPRDYISGIAVGKQKIADRIYGMYPTIKIAPIPLYLAPKVLTTEWSNLARQGQRPVEQLIY